LCVPIHTALAKGTLRILDGVGAADYVTKPFDGRALLVRLGNALRRAREANAS